MKTKELIETNKQYSHALLFSISCFLFILYLWISNDKRSESFIIFSSIVCILSNRIAFSVNYRRYDKTIFGKKTKKVNEKNRKLEELANEGKKIKEKLDEISFENISGVNEIFIKCWQLIAKEEKWQDFKEKAKIEIEKIEIESILPGEWANDVVCKKLPIILTIIAGICCLFFSTSLVIIGIGCIYLFIVICGYCTIKKELKEEIIKKSSE